MIRKLIALACIAAIVSSCNVEKKKEGALPDIDIDVDTEAGVLPEYDVDWADVNVGTTTKTVKVPKIVIVMEEEEVEVPFIDVDMPDGDEKEERTILIEAEVEDKEHKIEIEEIWASGKKLIVISRLTEMEQSLGDKKMRVSDQVTLNAPELDVKHYIVGERPNRVFNGQHKYVKNLDALQIDKNNVKVIYTK
ncbi:MAG: hypothetical protein WBG90_12370 [Saonia sp.]